MAIRLLTSSRGLPMALGCPGTRAVGLSIMTAGSFPDPVREREAKARMTEAACRLTPDQRRAVEDQIAKTCAYRGWTLHVVNCRSNHVHVVVSADVADPEKIRIDLKAWATRALKKQIDNGRETWWAERGSIRYLNTDDELEAATVYVREGQDGDRYQPDS